MAAKVADASVIGAIIFEEPAAPLALSLVEPGEIHVPDLLAYELASIARTKIVREPDRGEEILLALVRGLESDLHWIEVDHLAVVRIALASNLSTYDASYLYVARLIGAPLVTFDQKLIAASGGG